MQQAMMDGVSASAAGLGGASPTSRTSETSSQGNFASLLSAAGAQSGDAAVETARPAVSRNKPKVTANDATADTPVVALASPADTSTQPVANLAGSTFLQFQSAPATATDGAAVATTTAPVDRTLVDYAALQARLPKLAASSFNASGKLPNAITGAARQAYASGAAATTAAANANQPIDRIYSAIMQGQPAGAAAAATAALAGASTETGAAQTATTASATAAQTAQTAQAQAGSTNAASSQVPISDVMNVLNRLQRPVARPAAAATTTAPAIVSTHAASAATTPASSVAVAAQATTSATTAPAVASTAQVAQSSPAASLAKPAPVKSAATPQVSATSTETAAVSTSATGSATTSGQTAVTTNTGAVSQPVLVSGATATDTLPVSANDADVPADLLTDLPLTESEMLAEQQKTDALRDAGGAASTSTQTPHALRNASSAVMQAWTSLVQRLDGGTQRFEIRLDPAELGEIDVTIDISKDNKARIVMAVSNTDALADLSRGAKALEQALTEAGVDLAEDGISFEMSSDGRGSFTFEDDTGHQAADRPAVTIPDTVQDIPEQLVEDQEGPRLSILNRLRVNLRA